MLRDGPIPRAVHGAIEYLAAAAFIVVPLLLFEPGAGAATAASIIVGVFLLVLTATTVGPTSLVDQVPVVAHVVIDYLLAAFLIGAPFLLGFAGETAPLVFFLALGVAHLLITIATRFLPKGERAGSGPSEAPPAGPPAA